MAACDPGGGKSRPRPSTLTRQLLAWTLGALLIVWAGFIFIGWRTGIDEADELTDGHLATAAALLLRMDLAMFAAQGRALAVAPRRDLKRHDYQQSFSALIWSKGGELATRIGDSPLPSSPPNEGYADLLLGQPPVPWRAYSQWTEGRERMVTVLVSNEERGELATDIAQDLTEFGFWLLPVVLLALGLALARGLRPLYQLSGEVAALDVARGERLANRRRLREFDSVVSSINRLIATQQAALTRERQLASEVAHELRTPLASIALQARALAGPLADDERREAAARIGQDALRAGHVLDQLLALARASRAELTQVEVDLDLAALARRVVGDFAQAAWERGHTLAVTGVDALPVRGHPLLLELALFNLVDNAVRHTGQGATIEVDVGRSGSLAWLKVLDDGGAASASPRANTSAESLGLGLRIVERVADLHGARFSRCAAPAPFCTGYQLALPVIPRVKTA